MKRFSYPVLLALLIALPCAADETSPNVPLTESRQAAVGNGTETSRLLGDWNGLRSTLIDHGVTFRLGYIGEVFGNFSASGRTGAPVAGFPA